MSDEQLQFVLVSESKRAKVADLYRLAQALEINAYHCADAWGMERPTIDVVAKLSRAPRNYHPIFFVEGSDKDPGALAVHYVDPTRNGPAAIIYVDRASGFNAGTSSVAEAASHEVVEALINPRVNLWLPHPDPSRFGVQVAREVGDPTQATYDVRAAGTDWKMTSFVTPAWFDSAANDPIIRERVLRGGGFDHDRKLRFPGDVGPDGYVILRERRGDRWHFWYEDGNGVVFGAAPVSAGQQLRAHSASARTKLLMQSCA